MNSHQKTQIEKLRRQGIGYLKIANMLSLSVNTVKAYCRRNNLTGDIAAMPPEAAKEYFTLTFCKNCGAEIEPCPGRKRRKFCSGQCRQTWWNTHPDQVDRKAVYHLVCAGCEQTFDSYGNINRKYCSHSCYIADRFKKQA